MNKNMNREKMELIEFFVKISNQIIQDGFFIVSIVIIL
jgi:hypothetical protein